MKETLGNDAIILSNRGVPGGVEIMAVAARHGDDRADPVADGAPVPGRRRRWMPMTITASCCNSARAAFPAGPAPVPPAPPNQRPVMHQAMRAETGRDGQCRYPEEQRPRQSGMNRRQISKRSHRSGASRSARRHLAPAACRRLGRRAEAEVVPMEVMEEMPFYARSSKHLAGFAWGEMRAEPVKTDILRQMLDAGFSPQFARDLLADLPPEMDASQAMAWVKGRGRPVVDHDHRRKRHVDRAVCYALVGPTGVGKTTTTAKLAARCVLASWASKGCAGYRRLPDRRPRATRIYGRILGVSVHLVKDAIELRRPWSNCSTNIMVLIDTMGMSQRDKLVPVTDMLAGCDVKRLVLLNSTAGRGDTLDDVVRAYAGDLGRLHPDQDRRGCQSGDGARRHHAPWPAAALCLERPAGAGRPAPAQSQLSSAPRLQGCAGNSPHKFDGVEPGWLMANAGLMAVGGVVADFRVDPGGRLASPARWRTGSCRWRPLSPDAKGVGRSVAVANWRGAGTPGARKS